MSIHTLPWTFEELGVAENKSLEVEFACCVNAGSRGSRWEPPEPTEVEFYDVKIIELLGEHGKIEVSPDLEHTLKEIAFVLADKHRAHLEESLLERIGDADEAALEDYYDRKRDEARGC